MTEIWICVGAMALSIVILAMIFRDLLFLFVIPAICGIGTIILIEILLQNIWIATIAGILMFIGVWKWIVKVLYD